MKFTPTLNNPYIGVTKAKRSRKWIATISHKGRTLVVGFFIDAVDAAKARDLAAIKYRGESAVLNFPDVIKNI